MRNSNMKNLTVFSRFCTLILSSVLMLSSCGGDSVSTIKDEITVSPATVSFPSQSGSESVEVTANCSWTAEVTGVDGSDASWLVLGKTRGTGNATVTLRVFENKYNAERKASLVFTTSSGEVASVSVVQKASSDGENLDSFDVRVGSYNVRMSVEDKDHETRNWTVRQGFLWTSIDVCDFDVVGLQEVSTEQQADMKEKWSSEYGLYFFSPYSQNGVGDKAQGLMYRSNLFTLSETHFFWLGPDPDKMSTSDVGTNGNFNRGGFCGILTHKATGLRLFFMNTHGALSEDAKTNYAGVFESIEKRYNVDALPSFLVGDMNAVSNHEMMKTICGYWSDSYVDAESRKGIANTFNSYNSPNGVRRIDYVLYRNVAAPSLYCCDNTLYNGQYASDHFPVYADFTIRK